MHRSLMENQAADAAAVIQGPRVKATIKLGSETYSVEADKGTTISAELLSFKEKTMSVLKDFITKHNVPNDVPDELAETSSDDDEDLTHNSSITQSKKTKLT